METNVAVVNGKSAVAPKSKRREKLAKVHEHKARARKANEEATAANTALDGCLADLIAEMASEGGEEFDSLGLNDEGSGLGSVYGDGAAPELDSTDEDNVQGMSMGELMGE